MTSDHGEVSGRGSPLVSPPQTCVWQEAPLWAKSFCSLHPVVSPRPSSSSKPVWSCSSSSATAPSRPLGSCSPCGDPGFHQRLYGPERQHKHKTCFTQEHSVKCATTGHHLLRLRLLLVQHRQRSGKVLVFMDLLFQLCEVGGWGWGWGTRECSVTAALAVRAVISLPLSPRPFAASGRVAHRSTRLFPELAEEEVGWGVGGLITQDGTGKETRRRHTHCLSFRAGDQFLV